MKLIVCTIRVYNSGKVDIIYAAPLLEVHVWPVLISVEFPTVSLYLRYSKVSLSMFEKPPVIMIQAPTLVNDLSAL